MNDLVDEVVLLVDDLRLIVLVQHVGQIDGVFFRDLLVVFKQFERIPTLVGKIRILLVQLRNDAVDLVLDRIRIHHGIFGMMIMDMMGNLRMLMDELLGFRMPLVVNCRMQQDVKALALPRTDGNDGNAQHLGQTVQIDLHAALFHNVHHVERQDNGLFQLQKLERQIETALERRGVHDVDHDVHFVAQDKLTGDRLLHRVRRETVRPGKIDKMNPLIVLPNGAFHLFDGHPGPVRDLQVCARIGVKQRRLAAVRVSDKTDCQLAFRRFTRVHLLHLPRYSS